MRFLQLQSIVVPTTYHPAATRSQLRVTLLKVSLLTIVMSPRVQYRLGTWHGRVYCYSTHCLNPSGILVSISLFPATSGSQSSLHIHRMVFPLGADCPEFNTSVLRVDFCNLKMNTRWYVLLIECQVGFCVAHFEDGVPRRLTNLCSFARHVRVHVVLGVHRLFRFLDGCIHLDPPPRTT